MKLLLRLALLTLCGAAGILIAVHLAATHSLEAKTSVAVVLPAATETVAATPTEAGAAAEERSAPDEVASPPQLDVPQPRTAQQVPAIAGPTFDLSFLKGVSEGELDAAMSSAFQTVLQNGESLDSAAFWRVVRGGDPGELSKTEAAQFNLFLPILRQALASQAAAAGPGLVAADAAAYPNTGLAQAEPLPVGQAVPPPPQPPTSPPVAPVMPQGPSAALQMEPLPPAVTAGDDGLLTINSRDADVRSLLEQLAEQAGLNMLASENVQGTVTVNLQKVTTENAIETVLRAAGFVSRRDGNIMYVGTTADFAALEQSLDRIGTRVYRPNYLNAKEMANLLTPLLSPSVGKISVTSPAATGIAADNTTAGGDSISQQDALVIQDYERVLAQIDQVYRELDRRPAQVSIEAVIVSVTLNDANQFGVDFQVLRDKNNVRFGWGSPRQAPLEGGGNVDPVTGGNIGEFQFDTGGLKFAFLDDSLGVFLNALETVGDANVIASPKLLCLNKQKAEILIGQRLGYISTTVTQNFSTQNVEFLDVGAQLRLRPFIASDGLIRMEVHPELSEGQVVVNGGFTLPQKTLTEVTTNVMCPDGCTVIIGGLMRENLRTSATQVPLLGSLPLAGPLFRTKTDTVERTEILVLLTPRIIEDGEAAADGDARRQETFDMEGAKFHRMSPLGKAHLSRDYLMRAQNALSRGDRGHAQRFARLAVHYDPLNREAVVFWNRLNGGGGHVVDQGWGARAAVGDDLPLPATVDGDVPGWMLDDLGAETLGMPPQLQHPRDPGLPGREIEIVRPEIFGHDKP